MDRLQRDLWLVQAVFGVAVGLAGAACCSVPDMPAPLAHAGQLMWTVSVPAGNGNDDFAPASFEASRHIAFASDEELVAISEDGPFGGRTVAAVLAARDGHVVRSVTWDSKHPSYVFATSDGQYVIASEGNTTLYSRGLERALTRRDGEVAYLSPDRRVLARTRQVSLNEHGASLFDASTLGPLTAAFRGPYLWSFTEHLIAHVASATNGNGLVLLTDPSGHEVQWESECRGKGREIRPSFVSNDLVAVVDCRLDVITTAGALVFSAELAADHAYVAATSATGSRFAIAESFSKPGDPPTICTERIVVFDVARRTAVFMTDVADFAGRSLGRDSGLAFSPSGSHLAVKSGDRVRMFALPQVS
jgi:hypothetical protein